jgi:PAS domain S-box-containing protein
MNGILGTSDDLHSQRRTILVIHDNLADLRLMSGYLEEVGLEVLDAGNGEEGLRKARHAQPDLILLDVLMPGVDGFETLRRLKADKALQEIPVILMMAPSMEEGWRKGFQSGAGDYITKPFQREEVLARIATHLHLRDLTRKVDEAQQALERGVESRTAELVSANAQLRAELAELKRAEEAWKESEEQHRITLENILDPVFITNDEGQFTFVCTNVSHILGYAMEEIQAMDNIAQLVGEDLFNLEELRVLGQIPNIERVIVDGQGRERTFLITVKRVSIKKGTILYACRDVTERRWAEEALSRSLQDTARGQQLLLALAKAAQAVQCARTPAEVYQTVPAELAGLGYRAIIYTPADDPQYLAPSYWTPDSLRLRQVEELSGGSLEHARLAITPGGLCGQVLSEERPLFFQDVAEFVARSFPELPSSLAEQMAALMGPGQAICAPLSTGGELHGLLLVLGSDLQEADLVAVTAFTNQAAVAFENARLLEAATKHKEELQRLSNQLLDAQEAERKRISLELHDELGQALTVIGMNLEELGQALASEVSPQLKESLVETTSLADETLEQVREMALGLRPSLLDDLGLVPALRWYLNRLAQRLPIEISFEATDGRDRLPPQLETAIYRIVQEALTNITRHAQASRVHVHLECTASAIVTTIEDDGRGFDPEAAASRGGVGLLGMRERAVLLGGSVGISSQPGRGTRLTLEIPWGRDA